MHASSDHALLLHRANAAFQRGALSEARQWCEQVVSRFGEDANARMLLGIIRIKSGDSAGGIEELERARNLMPTHVHVLGNLGLAYFKAGRLQDARSTLEAAVRVDPRFATAHGVLGDVLLDSGERTAARKAFEQALALQPGYVEPMAGLARLAEKEHRLDDARLWSEQALALAPRHALATLTRARVALREGEPDRAIALLEILLRDGSPTETNRVIAEGYLGEAFDQTGRYDEAFAAFSRANDIQHARYLGEFGDGRGPLSPATVARLIEFVGATDVSTWSPAPPVSGKVPVFLIGFPRSGTTLLDQVLASHPSITTLEERDCLLDASRALIREDRGFDDWASLPASKIETLRALYWQQVATGLRGEPIRDVFIDKLPLNAIYLPLIHRLFPTARIVLALRDPRDVVLSCHRQRFGMNHAMFQLLRLDSAVAYYDAVMTLVRASRARLPLAVHAIKYESLVGDFDASVAALLAFLGLEWTDSMRDYASTARKRTIDTPSAAQVVLPLYGSARGKWRRYRRFLEPYLPMLDAWVDAFGYEASKEVQNG
jgi:tetratricopeptide (TPR) repeat protein